MSDKLFEPIKIGNLTLKNRIVRSATFEGMCDDKGFPTNDYHNLYDGLAKNGIGAIITGFAYVSPCGRAMHPGQAGIDEDDKIPVYMRITDAVHRHDGKIVMQIAHSGRQTVAKAVGGIVKGASGRRSAYFGSNPKALTTKEAVAAAQQFTEAALRAKKAGFDGVQLHAAHGYLIHEFILPSLNTRADEFGIDREFGIGTQFLKTVIEETRARCGRDFPVLVKVSASDDYRDSFSQDQFVQLIRFLDRMAVDAIEVSYGTMDDALSIFRGESVPIDTILKHNPRYGTGNAFRRFLRKEIIYPFVKSRIRMFTPMYNLPDAKITKKHTRIPVMCVGGFRKRQEMVDALKNNETDLISLCRPFICEPDFVGKLSRNNSYVSKCVNCNICAVMCDSGRPTRCYLGKNL